MPKHALQWLMRQLRKRPRPFRFFWNWAGRAHINNEHKRWKALVNLAGYKVHEAHERAEKAQRNIDRLVHRLKVVRRESPQRKDYIRDLERELARWRKSRKRAWAAHARWKRARPIYNRKRKRALRRKRRRNRPDDPKPGPPSGEYGGSQSVGEAIVLRIAERFGAWISSRKRTYDTVAGDAMSWHYIGCTICYAWDIATFNGEPIARALAEALGIHNWQPGSYAVHTIVVGGVTYYVQILWAVSGHFDHVHIGIKRA